MVNFRQSYMNQEQVFCHTYHASVHLCVRVCMISICNTMVTIIYTFCNISLNGISVLVKVQAVFIQASYLLREEAI